MLALRLRDILLWLAGAGILLGFAARWIGMDAWSPWIWAAFTLPVLLALLSQIVMSLRQRDVGLDIVAALSMSAALVFGEELAAIVVAAMYAGGQRLESYAERRAQTEMTALLSRVPRTALRHRDDALEEVDLEQVSPGDHLLIRQGDMVPVDGTVMTSGVAVLDQSMLTGESIPVSRHAGEAVMSGATNAGGPFDLLAQNTAAESTYAGIVRLVEAAQRSKAPMARLADRFAIVFLVLTVLMAGAAGFVTGDPIRAVAVLVIATPCPLILAVPVAMVSGLSRAARHGILVKGGGPLETLARIRSLVIDKTGTLTKGRARIVAVEPFMQTTPDEIVRLAASLDQTSKHTTANAIVEDAHGRGLRLSTPTGVIETPGAGIEGDIDGRRVVVGNRDFVSAKMRLPPARPRPQGQIAVAVGVDGMACGEIVLADQLRSGIDALLQQLRGFGMSRLVLATGDHKAVTRAMAQGLGFDAIRTDLTPDQKVLVVLSERKNGPVMMVGDGVNDAPALAAADVGVAMGARGSAASAEAADVVLLVDDLHRILPAVAIAKETRFIALQSVYVGLSLSFLGMIAAAFGYLTPVQGALLQEAIDVAVVLNALRALSDRAGFVHTQAASES